MASKLKIFKDYHLRNNIFFQYNKIYLKTCQYYKKNIIFPKFLITKNIANIFYLYKNKKISKSKIHNRCIYTGRSQSVHSKYRMTRMTLKMLSLFGNINGLKKSSW